MCDITSMCDITILDGAPLRQPDWSALVLIESLDHVVDSGTVHRCRRAGDHHEQ
jgi:hypothetical protein